MKFILIFIFPTVFFAQEFYISDVQLATNTSRIKTVDGNLNVTNIVEVDQNAGLITDIALAPDGTLYAVSTIDALISIDLNTGDFDYLFPLGPGTFNNLVYDDLHDELIAIDTNNLRILRIDPITGSINFSSIGIATPGDLTFYEGNLIFQETFTLDIYTYDNVSTKKVSCFGEVEVFGFSNFINSCGENLIYGFNESGSVFSFDIENNSYTLVGDISSNTFTVSGATTVNEYIASTCTLQALDVVDCSLGLTETAFNTLQFYPNPVMETLYVDEKYFSDDQFYSIRSMDGKEITSGTMSSKIDMSMLQAGFYFITVHDTTGSVTVSKKVIKH